MQDKFQVLSSQFFNRIQKIPHVHNFGGVFREVLFVFCYDKVCVTAQGSGKKLFVVDISAQALRLDRAYLGRLGKYQLKQFLTFFRWNGVVKEMNHPDRLMEDIVRDDQFEFSVLTCPDDLCGSPVCIKQAGKKDVGVDDGPQLGELWGRSF